VARKKNPAAVALGQLGGRKKVPKGFAVTMQDPAKKQEIAQASADARRGKKRGK
jgi:hypothetical protein